MSAPKDFLDEIISERTEKNPDFPAKVAARARQGVPEFTPGPWRVITEVSENTRVHGPDEQYCNDNQIAKMSYVGEVAQADACLIAAAPELYAALEMAMNAIRGEHQEDRMCMCRSCEAFRLGAAALKKARGE